MSLTCAYYCQLAPPKDSIVHIVGSYDNSNVRVDILITTFGLRRLNSRYKLHGQIRRRILGSCIPRFWELRSVTLERKS